MASIRSPVVATVEHDSGVIAARSLAEPQLRTPFEELLLKPLPAYYTGHARVSIVHYSEMQQAMHQPPKPTLARWQSSSQPLVHGKDVTLETALGGRGIPLHPGSAKFYKEAGLIK